MIAFKIYVQPDSHGVYRIGQTRVSLESVAYAFQQGHSAETIAEQYPALSLEEVHGAIAFYLANREEVHAYLAQQEKAWQNARRHAEQSASPLLERLRGVRAARREGA